MFLGSLHALFFTPPMIIAALAGVAIGFLLGRYIAARPFRHQIRDFAASETLGSMLSVDERQSYALAFKDAAAAGREMDHFVYAVPNVPTPFVGCGPSPGQNENALINEMQFRSRSAIALPKPQGIYRIFLTGGSTAFGSGAPSQEAIVGAYLENQLNNRSNSLGGVRYEVLTLANPSWTSTHERIVIENRLSELAPDLVISLSGSNDVHWAGAGQNVFWFRTYAEQHFWELLNAARKLGGLQPMPEVVPPTAPVPPARVAERLEKNVRLSTMALALIDACYVFVLQPGLAVSSKPLSTREQELRTKLAASALENFSSCYEQIKTRLAAISHERFLFLDRSDVFADLSATDEIFLDSYHFGDRGNEILAQAIEEGIRASSIRLP